MSRNFTYNSEPYREHRSRLEEELQKLTVGITSRTLLTKLGTYTNKVFKETGELMSPGRVIFDVVKRELVEFKDSNYFWKEIYKDTGMKRVMILHVIRAKKKIMNKHLQED